jgi:2-amino-1-hydroxyethylphosphonate dioxygenase (glycine-forming)
MTEEKAKAIVDEIFSLYENYGAEDYIGEPVSQIEHMCQSAQLAEEEGFDEEVILAAFFHDVGHLCEHVLPVSLMDGYGVTDHEELGANYLKENFFSERIAKLVESHVRTKRYLTYRFPDYYEKLSSASRMTLSKQGGVMTSEEAEVFESDPLSDLYIRLRQWDDQAKVEHKPLPDLEKYKDMAYRHLLSEQQ